MSEVKIPEEGMAKPLAMLAMFGLLQAVGGLFALTLMYGVVVIIFRFAFHVELWNPFR